MSITIEALNEAVLIKQQITELEARLEKILGGTVVSARSGKNNAEIVKSSVPSGGRRRRKMSAEARAKIAAAQRARWAKAKGA